MQKYILLLRYQKKIDKTPFFIDETFFKGKHFSNENNSISPKQFIQGKPFFLEENPPFLPLSLDISLKHEATWEGTRSYLGDDT